MGRLEELSCLEENGQLIFVNTENRSWVRMPQYVYHRYVDLPDGDRLLAERIQEKYHLFQPADENKALLQSVYFAVTGRCNLCCGFCTMNSGPQVSRECDMTLEEIRGIVLPKILEINPKKVVLTGGEPFARNDMIEIIKLFGENFDKYRITLQTNGLLMTEEMIDEISNYIGAIEFSIENLFENDGHLQRMKKIFEMCQSKRIPLSFSFVVHDKTVDYLKAALDLCYEFDAYFSMRMVSMLGRAKINHASDRIKEEKIQEAVYIEVLRYVLEKKYFKEQITGVFLSLPQIRKNCGAFGNICAIHADGQIYMCENFKEERYSFGNIKKESVALLRMQLIKKMNTDSFQKEFLENKPEACQKCKVNCFCTGPCSAVCAENPTQMITVCRVKKRLLQFNLFYHTQKKTAEENLQNLLVYLMRK